MTNLITNLPQRPVANLVLAHGAGAGADTPFMTSVATALCEMDVAVYRFNFPYMQVIQESGKRRPPDKMPKLISSYSEVIEGIDDTLPLFIGGKSMGGRVASMMVDSTRAVGTVCLGYPFHPPGKPDNLRTEHLENMSKPLLVVQGQRDTFGKQEEVEGYRLSDAIQIAFLPDGDHSFKPRKASGITEQQNLLAAARRVVEFIKETL